MKVQEARGTILTKISFVALFAAVTLAASFLNPPFGPWKRLGSQPVIAPQGSGFESAGTFNPAVIEKDNKIVMLYRAQDHQGTSTLGYAVSDDGVHFSHSPAPVLSPEAPYKKGGGTEDPRLVKVGGTYYLTYTGYNKVEALAKTSAMRSCASRRPPT